MGSAVCQSQSPLGPPWLHSPERELDPRGLADAFAGAGQLDQRAEGSEGPVESLWASWLLGAGRVPAPGQPHPNSRTDLVEGGGAAQETADR